MLFAKDLSLENVTIIEMVIAHKQIANVHNRRIVFFGGLSAHSNAVGIVCEFLPTSNHRQADRTDIAAAYHRVRATTRHNEIDCFHKKRMLLYHEGTVTLSMRKRQ